MKNRKNLTTSTLVMVAFLVLPLGAKAVNPPPDGGYPGGNTAEGDSALLSLTTGTYNTAVGLSSLQDDTIGSFNTATGAEALLANAGNQNTATGAQALLSNTSGSFNTANGALALHSNTTGLRNTVNGYAALYSNISGSDNTANGVHALFNNTTAGGNTAVGSSALQTDTTGPENTAIGASALEGDTSGAYNTATGWGALFSNTIGGQNTAIGVQALFRNTTGENNTANGTLTLYSNRNGSDNTANGIVALQNNTTGSYNTAIGAGALGSNTAGTFNIGLGTFAGQNVTTAHDVIAIGVDANNVSNSCYIGNIFGATSAGGTAVFVNMNGRLGTTTSSRRFKEDIKRMDKASEGLLALNPVTFRYKRGVDPEGLEGGVECGLVAEDVEKVNPDLVVHDKEGKPYSVRYDQVNAMLLNEFLKEHKKVEKFEATVGQQQKSFEAKLAEQHEQIKTLISGLQRVSAQLELNKTAPQTALNNP